MPAKSAIAFGTGYGRDGGFRYFGADGKLHWVPPWNPEISRDFSIAATLANRAEHVTDRSVCAQIEGAAQALVGMHAQAIQHHLGGIGAGRQA